MEPSARPLPPPTDSARKPELPSRPLGWAYRRQTLFFPDGARMFVCWCLPIRPPRCLFDAADAFVEEGWSFLECLTRRRPGGPPDSW